MLSVIRSNELIIDMDHENDSILPLLSNILTGVGLRRIKTDRLEPGVVDLLVEVTRCLFGTVQRFVEFQYLRGISSIPFGWIDEDIIVRFELSVERPR